MTRELPEAASVRFATLLFWDRRLETFHSLNPGETQAHPVRPQPDREGEPRARYLLSEGQLLDTGGEGGTTLIPLQARSGLVGMIVLGERRRSRRPFRNAEVRLLQDVARRSALAIENHLYQRELIASERMAALGTMAGMLAHDFRGPMTVIRGYAETLLEGGLPEAEVKERAELITRMVDRLERMTCETLDFARGSGHLVRRSMPLRLMLMELSEGLESELPGLAVERHYELPDEGQASFDLDKLRRALFNMAANARDAMGGKGLLRLHAKVVDGRLVLELRDEGPGVPPELRDRLFEPFVTHGKKGGTGLGLAVARRFVEDHGGQVDLVPEGKGACFRIRLPLGI
ncbi:MAG TPA: HAMP domain-containing sensor histidine kinase [Vicinamibacteria bacterium]|nr:HAMP domain-containing sensor histidine kinase [Vicinamibacteria bacterium]